MKIGYVRVSSICQNEARQIAIMNDFGVDKIFTDKASGKSIEGRPAFIEMMSFVREGDTVYTESISRISRNTRDFLSIIETLTKRKVDFVSQKEQIDTSSPSGRFLLTVLSAISELERENIRARTAEGIKIAKEKGIYKGRKPIAVNEDKFSAVCKRWKNGEITAVKAMSELNLKPNTFYRRVKSIGL